MKLVCFSSSFWGSFEIPICINLLSTVPLGIKTFVKHIFEKSVKTRSVKIENEYHFPIFLASIRIDGFPFNVRDFFFEKFGKTRSVNQN